jgi:two-component system response regulator RegX3
MPKILLVEDDKEIVDNLTDFLQSEGFEVEYAMKQRDALSMIENQHFDIALVDLSLPDGSGFTVCSAARAKGSPPVIFLTAADDEFSVVTGLELGAEDFIVKPFRPRELISRIKTSLRRHKPEILEYKGIVLDSARATVQKNGKEIILSSLEYRLLLFFFVNKGRILSRNMLLNEIWDAAGDYVNDNTLTVYIKRLRGKIEDDPISPIIIRTIRGLGYRLGD